MHMYATHLMDAYDGPYTNVEINEELGVKLSIRIYPFGRVDVDTVRWDYKLDGRGAMADGEDVEVSCIKWRVDVDEIPGKRKL